MKIVHVCSEYSEGWSYQENLLAKYHARLGHDVTLVSGTYGFDSNGKMLYCDESGYVNKDGVKIIRLRYRNNRSFDYKFKDLDGLHDCLKDERPDVIFVHGVQFVYLKTIKEYAKKNPNVTVYADNHGDGANSGSNWLSKNILHKVVWRHYVHQLEPYVKKFYGVLPSRVEWLCQIYKVPRERVELLLMGADDDLVEKANQADSIAEIREHHGIAQDDFLIVTGGKINATKAQVLNLMEAVNMAQNQKAKLIVFGPVVDSLKQKLLDLCSDRVIYIPWLSTEDSYRYFAASDLIVFPGSHSVYWEEAAGVGRPMIVNCWNGEKHLDLGGNCIYLKQNTTQEMKRYIDRLSFKGQEYQSMMKVAAEKGMKVFSYLQIARQSLELN